MGFSLASWLEGMEGGGVRWGRRWERSKGKTKKNKTTGRRGGGRGGRRGKRRGDRKIFGGDVGRLDERKKEVVVVMVAEET